MTMNYEELLLEAYNVLNEIPNRSINCSGVVKDTYELASLIERTIGKGVHKKCVLASYYSVDDVMKNYPDLSYDDACDFLSNVSLETKACISMSTSEITK